MNSKQFAEQTAMRVIQSVVGEQRRIQPNDQLLGEGGLVDSMKLVEICLALEDESTSLGFDFDWTSDTSMSASRSVFRTVETLAQEYSRQWQAGASGSGDSPST
jgi:acyl carrier protein